MNPSLSHLSSFTLCAYPLSDVSVLLTRNVGPVFLMSRRSIVSFIRTTHIQYDDPRDKWLKGETVLLNANTTMFTDYTRCGLTGVDISYLDREQQMLISETQASDCHASLTLYYGTICCCQQPVYSCKENCYNYNPISHGLAHAN